MSDVLRGSLWPLPAAMIVAAVALAFGTLALDESHVAKTFGFDIFRAGPSGARSTLSALATSLMTIAGVSISLTMIVLQLASNQYSPRVVRTLLRDWLLQIVFGAYVATFTYVLLILRSIRSSDEDSHDFVAPISVTSSVVLGTACVVLLVVFVHHVARSLRAASIVDRISRETAGAIDTLFPDEVGTPREPAPDSPPHSGAPRTVHAREPGYVALIDDGSFPRDATLVEVPIRIGDFVRRGDVLARVWGAPDRSSRDEEAAPHMVEGFVLTSERTMQQDVRLGFQLLTDVALRALSPGVNDPTTAIDCVNRIGDLLCRLAKREFPAPTRRLGRTIVRLTAPALPEIVRLSLDPLITYGQSDARLFGSVLEALEALVRRDPDCATLEVVRSMCDELVACVSQAHTWTAHDRAVIRDRAAALRRTANGEPD
jgi:uncharacterized membrane protein